MRLHHVVPQAAIMDYSVLCSLINPAPHLMYSAADLYKLRLAVKPPLSLLNHPDLLRRPKYIHHGSRWNIRISTAKPGQIWSTNSRLKRWEACLL